MPSRLLKINYQYLKSMYLLFHVAEDILSFNFFKMLRLFN
jgi:hypothetical protein